ncbi:olfactory receptor 14C36-like [Eudromia elegans]
MSNSSSFNEFFLLPFTDTWELQLLHFSLCLGIYLAALLGNGLIITAVACDHHLHTPMYFFLLNLSLLDICSISTTVPKSMANSLWDSRDISHPGCAAQIFLFVFFTSAEYSLLTIMAYDRYVAICRPLHYRTLMDSRACVNMAAAAWASGFLNALLHTGNTFSVPLCQGNEVEQFFCEIPQILKLSCSHFYLGEVGLIVFSACLFFGCFLFIVVSYVQIFRAVLRIPSEQGRHKAFSMCLPHLAVVSLFVTTAFFTYLKPPSISSPTLDLTLPILYSVVPPSVNPLIYSMRNRELKEALRKLFQWVQEAPHSPTADTAAACPPGEVAALEATCSSLLEPAAFVESLFGETAVELRAESQKAAPPRPARAGPGPKQQPGRIVCHLGAVPLRVHPDNTVRALSVLSIRTEPLEQLESSCLLLARNSFYDLWNPNIMEVELLRDARCKWEVLERLYVHAPRKEWQGRSGKKDPGAEQEEPTGQSDEEEDADEEVLQGTEEEGSISLPWVRPSLRRLFANRETSHEKEASEPQEEGKSSPSCSPTPDVEPGSTSITFCGPTRVCLTFSSPPANTEVSLDSTLMLRYC